jgi:hypothetical protein
MVVKRKILLVVSAALMTMAAATPALAGYGPATPDPLAQQSLLRVEDIAATGKMGGIGPVVAVGWRQGSKPGELFVAYSVDGGKSYLKQDGELRQFRVAGDGTIGLALDACSKRVWAVSAANFPGDDPADTDVLVTSRTVSGEAGQAFMTDAAASRKVTSVSISCLGNRLLAIAWLEQSFGKPRAKLMLRSLEPLGETTSFRKVYGLGEADIKSGISVDASTDAVHVAWTAGKKRDLMYQRYLVAAAELFITQQPSVKLASADARFSQVAARGQQAVVAYSDAGKLTARVSADAGENFAKADRLLVVGSPSEPSQAHSADVSADRIVVEASANKGGAQTPQRIQSIDSGATWDTTSFGNVGARVGALRKTSPTSSLLAEAWQNNDAGVDTLRAQYEK